MDPRRIAVFSISLRALLSKPGGLFEIVTNDIPADAEILGVSYDRSLQALDVIVRSESLPSVAVPFLTGPSIRRLPEAEPITE